MKNKIFYLYFVCLIASIGGILFGFSLGIIAGVIPFIQPYFGWSDLELGWGVSSLLLGAMIGAFVSGTITDRYGRKKILIIVSLFFAAAFMIMAIATKSSIFIMARVLGGVTVGAISVIVPVYIAEIALPKNRGMFISIYQLAIVIGILMAYLLNFGLHDVENNWRWMFASGVIPSVLFFTGLIFIPESPRWLYRTGKKDKSFEILAKVGGSEFAKHELLEIAESLKTISHSVRIKELFKPDTRMVVFIGFTLAILVQVTGINIILEYAPTILLAAGVDLKNALLQTSLIGVINFIFTFVAILLIDRIGRRLLYLIGSSGMTISLIMLAFSFYFGMSNVFTLICILIFIAFFASSIGPVFWTLVSEIFPNRIRGVGVSFASFTQWTFTFIVVLFFPYFLSLIGGAGTFLFLALMALIQLVFTYFYIPETKGKSLEEIERHWEN